jgi:hypothetical protein
MWLLVGLFVAGLIGVAIQHHALKKMRGGFKLREGVAARRSGISDPEDEARRRWLEGEDDDSP